MLSPKIEDNDSASEYSDDDAVGRGRSEPESKPILSIRKYLVLPHIGTKHVVFVRDLLLFSKWR